MTTYRDRHLDGQYSNKSTQQLAELEDNGNEHTLAELKAEAEELGLPSYGTKAQIAKRIERAQEEAE